MNKDELLNVLNTLDKSKDSVILLDGRWGSGKTHLLNEFIKKYKTIIPECTICVQGGARPKRSCMALNCMSPGTWMARSIAGPRA